MWIPKEIAGRQPQRQAANGSVVYSDGAATSINATQEYNLVEKIAPYGIAYAAPVGAKGVVMPIGSSQVCAGVVCEGRPELKEGELLLFSSGGAEIYLKNDGTVVINGTVFEKGGE